MECTGSRDESKLSVAQFSASEIEKGKAENDFISSVSHELRTPLTSIKAGP